MSILSRAHGACPTCPESLWYLTMYPLQVKLVSTNTKGIRIGMCSLTIGKVMTTQSVVLRSGSHTVEMLMKILMRRSSVTKFWE